ncbi:MAG: protein translocase subunit SecF [Hyphomicrobiaceae bacterium]
MLLNMKGFDFFPHDLNIDFMRVKGICFAASIVAIIASIGLFLTLGLNYGIDFKGGALIEVKTKAGPADLGDLRQRLGGLGLGSPQVQTFGAPDDVLIRIEEQPGGEAAQQAVIAKVQGALGDTVEYRRTEVVGPAVSSELRETGAIAVACSILAIIAYVWFRFEWQFAIGGTLALVHDVALTVGLFSLLQLEFDLPIVAALLTILGYSINDTVVVSDRIRENLRKYKKMPLAEVLNRSINETLSRTILTGGTTLIALIALLIFGGEVIRNFTLAMIWGVLVGTYSSIFVAAPVLDYLGVKRDWSGGNRAKGEGVAAGKA